MDPISLIVLLVIGAIAGWLAGQVMKGKGFGMVGNIVVGVVGSVIAGWLLAGYMPIPGMMGQIITAAIGSIILLAVSGMVKRA